MSQKANDTLIISRGSSENVDPEAEVISSGQSQIKAFDLSKVPSGKYLFQNSMFLVRFPKPIPGDVLRKRTTPDHNWTIRSHFKTRMLTPEWSQVVTTSPRMAYASAGVCATQWASPNTPKQAASIPSKTLSTILIGRVKIYIKTIPARS